MTKYPVILKNNFIEIEYVFLIFQGIRVLSPLTVSFHYVDIGHMYMYDFLLYELLRDYHL